MTAQDITKLILRGALKDRAAFDLLYRQTSAKLFGVCLRVLSDRAEAEEALQEVYVKIWTWLVAVARNHAIDRLRTRKPARAGLDEAADVADPAPNPETQALTGGERAGIERCMGELEAERATAVRRAYVRGDSYAELAEHFGVPLNTMRTWLRRSLIRLRECLER